MMNHGKAFIAVTAVILLVGTALWSAEPTARELNSQGYALYRQQRYEEAVAVFQKAIATDETFGLAHYNLACTLGILMKKEGGVCLCSVGDGVFSREDIIAQLELTLKYLPEKKEKMLTDPDLQAVRGTLWWQRFIGLDPAKAADVPTILLNVKRWFGPRPGVCGPELTFSSDRTFRFISCQDGQTYQGVYQVEGRKINLHFRKPCHDILRDEGEMGPDGLLRFNAIGNFDSRFDDCCSA